MLLAAKSSIEFSRTFCSAPAYLLSAYGNFRPFSGDKPPPDLSFGVSSGMYLDSIVIGSFVIMVVLPKSSGTVMVTSCRSSPSFWQFPFRCDLCFFWRTAKTS